jgi:putative oxidoreductase
MSIPKFNYPLLSRILIALLFVVAGVQKAIGFAATSAYIGTLLPMGAMIAMVIAALVIIVEVPVALAYAWGYRVCYTGGALVVFTILATVLVHRNVTDPVQGPMQLVMALKNIAIIGGILATTGTCSCNRCNVEITTNQPQQA